MEEEDVVIERKFPEWKKLEHMMNHLENRRGIESCKETVGLWEFVVEVRCERRHIVKFSHDDTTLFKYKHVSALGRDAILSALVAKGALLPLHEDGKPSLMSRALSFFSSPIPSQYVVTSLLRKVTNEINSRSVTTSGSLLSNVMSVEQLRMAEWSEFDTEQFGYVIMSAEEKGWKVVKLEDGTVVVCFPVGMHFLSDETYITVYNLKLTIEKLERSIDELENRAKKLRQSALKRKKSGSLELAKESLKQWKLTLGVISRREVHKLNLNSLLDSIEQANDANDILQATKMAANDLRRYRIDEVEVEKVIDEAREGMESAKLISEVLGESFTIEEVSDSELEELEKEHDNEELLRKQLEELKLPSHELPSTSSTANERSKVAEAQK